MCVGKTSVILFGHFGAIGQTYHTCSLLLTPLGLSVAKHSYLWCELYLTEVLYEAGGNEFSS